MAKNEPAEPPEPRLQTSSLLVGQNRHGIWVVRDPHGMRGGLFTCRAAALRFATLDHGRPRAAIMVPYPIEFDVRKPAAPANDTTPRIEAAANPGRPSANRVIPSAG